MWTATKSRTSADPPPDPLVAVEPGGERVVAADSLVRRRYPVAGLAEEAAERLAVPQLLVDPARQEGGHLGVERRAGGEEIPQEDHGVGLDVHHVGQDASLVARDRVLFDPVPLDRREVHLLGRA